MSAFLQFIAEQHGPISAVANAITAASVALALWQLLVSKRIAQLHFEDALSKEYRDLASRIPTTVFFGKATAEEEHKALRDEFFRYLDLCNEQICLRQRRRISETVWKSWRQGIQSNLALPGFSRAWIEVKERTALFEELRKLESAGFTQDPATWA